MAAVQTHPFKSRVIAITGAGSGIGLATAHYLAIRGASLSIADIQQSTLSSAAESIRAQSLSPHAKIVTTVLMCGNTQRSKPGLHAQYPNWEASMGLQTLRGSLSVVPAGFLK